MFRDSQGDQIRVANSAGSMATVEVGGPIPGDGNTLTFSDGPAPGRDGITLQSTGSMNYLVQGNAIHGSEIAFVSFATSSAIVTGEVLDNRVGTAGINGTTGIAFVGEGAGRSTFLAANNLTRLTGVGVQVEARERSQIDGAILDNDLASSSDPVSGNGLALYVGRSGLSTDASQGCFDVRNNQLDSALSSDVVYAVQAGCTLKLPGYAGSATGGTAAAAVNAYLSGRNFGASLFTGVVTGVVGSCP